MKTSQFVLIIRACSRDLDLRVCTVCSLEESSGPQNLRVSMVLRDSKSAGAKGDVSKIYRFVHPLYPCERIPCEVSVCTTLLHHITLQFIVLYYERSSFIVQQINQIQFLELLCNRKVIVGCNVEELKINHLMMFCCTLDVCIEVDYSEPKVYTNLLWNS